MQRLWLDHILLRICTQQSHAHELAYYSLSTLQNWEKVSWMSLASSNLGKLAYNLWNYAANNLPVMWPGESVAYNLCYVYKCT